MFGVSRLLIAHTFANDCSFLSNKDKKAVARANKTATPVAAPIDKSHSSSGPSSYLQDRRPLDAAQAAQNVSAVAGLANGPKDRSSELIDALLVRYCCPAPSS